MAGGIDYLSRRFKGFFFWAASRRWRLVALCDVRSRADLRIRLAIYRYETEGLSLAKAASLAGVSWAQMRDILAEQGVQLRLGPDNLEEAHEEVDALRNHFGASS